MVVLLKFSGSFSSLGGFGLQLLFLLLPALGLGGFGESVFVLPLLNSLLTGLGDNLGLVASFDRFEIQVDVDDVSMHGLHQSLIGLAMKLLIT